MIEELKKYYDDIENSLLNGYSIDDLKPINKADLDGYVWCIHQTEVAFDNNIVDFDEDSTIDKIKKEVVEELWDDVYTRLISGACELIYSFINNYGDEDENER